MSKKMSAKPAKNEIAYEDRACVFCDKVFVKSWYISMPTTWFFICNHCLDDLKKIIQ